MAHPVRPREANPTPPAPGHLRWLLSRLYAQVGTLVAELEPQSVLDVGCGEGLALEHLALPGAYLGVDVDAGCVAHCRRRFPDRRFDVQSVRALPYADGEFDVVLALDVLEYQVDAAAAVVELTRVARRGVVLSVPNEPFFQAGNAVRGRFPSSLGDRPEHVQHWGRWSFPKFLVATGALRDLKLRTAGPWLVVSARPVR